MFLFKKKGKKETVLAKSLILTSETMLHCARMRGGSGGTIAPGTQRKIEMASRLVPSQRAGEQAKPQQVVCNIPQVFSNDLIHVTISS